MLARERLGTTGIGRHFALVHDFQGCKSPPVASVNGGVEWWLFLIPYGIDWHALDDRPVHLVLCPVFRDAGRDDLYRPALAAMSGVWRGIEPGQNLTLSRMGVEDAVRWTNARSRIVAATSFRDEGEGG